MKSEFHYFNFNGEKCRLERVERKTILRAETEESDIPICLMRTKRGLVLGAKGNEFSLDDSGEKVTKVIEKQISKNRFFCIIFVCILALFCMFFFKHYFLHFFSAYKFFEF